MKNNEIDQRIASTLKWERRRRWVMGWKGRQILGQWTIPMKWPSWDTGHGYKLLTKGDWMIGYYHRTTWGSPGPVLVAGRANDMKGDVGSYQTASIMLNPLKWDINWYTERQFEGAWKGKRRTFLMLRYETARWHWGRSFE